MTAVTSVGADCPLTVLEHHVRVAAGWKPYETGFVSHCLVEPWHPAGITPPIRVAIIAIWLVPNVVAYAIVVRWALQRRLASDDRRRMGGRGRRTWVSLPDVPPAARSH